MEKGSPFRSFVLPLLSLALVYGAYRASLPWPSGPPPREPSTSVFKAVPPAVTMPARPSEMGALEVKESDIDLAIPLEDADAEPTLVGARTLSVIDAILERVGRELEQGRYGAPGELSFNMVFQFRQSLAAFRRLLENPFEGPDFRFSLKKEVLGRYLTGEQKILLGPDTIDSEGVFLAVLFHEYQHHLHHTIAGRQEAGDMVGLFYNELAAHLFEDLLASYLPASYFDRPFRGALPGRIRRLLESAKGDEAIELLLRYLLALRSEEGKLFYGFLRPVDQGAISRTELIEAIHPDFVPDEARGLMLREEREEPFER